MDLKKMRVYPHVLCRRDPIGYRSVTLFIHNWKYTGESYKITNQKTIII